MLWVGEEERAGRFTLIVFLLSCVQYLYLAVLWVGEEERAGCFTYIVFLLSCVQYL